MSEGGLGIEVAGETLTLLPRRAVWWARTATLLVADLHWGKSSVFQRHGLAVPLGPTAADVDELLTLLAACGARRLIVLGDLFHGPSGVTEAVLGQIERLSDEGGAEVACVAGNHDRGLLSRCAGRGVLGLGAAHHLPPFDLLHEPPARGSGAPWIAGHLHPVVRVGTRREKVRCAAFVATRHSLVLPSFGSFTGGALHVRRPGERLFLATPTAVIPWP